MSLITLAAHQCIIHVERVYTCWYVRLAAQYWREGPDVLASAAAGQTGSPIFHKWCEGLGMLTTAAATTALIMSAISGRVSNHPAVTCLTDFSTWKLIVMKTMSACRALSHYVYGNITQRC